MPLNPSELETFFRQAPPRRGGDDISRAILNLYLPKFVRVLMVAVALFCLAMTASTGALLKDRFRYAQEWRMLTKPLDECHGIVVNLQERKDARGATMYSYDFQYSPPEKEEALLTSFCFSSRPAAGPHAEVVVEYVRSEPLTSRIKGTRLSPVPLPLVLALPVNAAVIIGLLYGVVAYRKSWIRRLLREGVPVQAGIEGIQRGIQGSHRVLLGYEMGGKKRTGRMQLVLPKRKFELLQACREAGGRVSAIAHPDRKDQIFVLDLILPENRNDEKIPQPALPG